VWIVTDRAATARAVADDIDQAVRYQKSSAWAHADAALKSARQRLGKGGPADLRARLEQVASDAEFVRRLEAIRISRAYNKGNFHAFEDANQAYEAAFRQVGLRAEEVPPAVAGERVRQSNIQGALMDALYDWSVVAGARDKWPLRVAETADPDPTGWRARALSPELLQSQQAVDALASDPAIDAQPVSLLLVAAEAVFRANLDPLPLLHRAHRSRPNDFWVLLALGDLMFRLEKYPEATRYYQAAQAVRPDSGIPHYSLGLSLIATNRQQEAIEEYQEALRLGGDSSYVRGSLAVAFSMRGRHEEACREFDAVIRKIPPLSKYFGVYAYSLMEVGRHKEAAWWAVEAASGEPALAVNDTTVHHVLLRARRWDVMLTAWRKGMEIDPDAALKEGNWRGFAELALFCGNTDEYRRGCREQLDRFGNVKDAVVCEGIARACLLAEPSEDVLRQATAMVDRMLASEQRQRTWRYPYFMLCKAMVELRAGRPDSALQIVMGPAAESLEPARSFVAALAHARLGQAQPALANLTAGVLAFDWSPHGADGREAWMYHVLRREAQGAVLKELRRFLAGAYEPRDDLERIAMTAECQFRELHAMRARLLKQVMGSSPELAVKLRRLGIIPAAMAGCGMGEDASTLNDAERERWRAQARQWMREELASAAAAGGAGEAGATATKLSAGWQAIPELACVRDPAGLSRLPTAEQQEWADLWEQVRTLAPVPPPPRPSR
jgi:serine/threonine-protein kinase